MRPPDENQNGSTRPNFMSASRRAAGGDDNILARLERDAKRAAAGKPWKHARIAWSLLASVLVFGLIGTLASLAWENLAVHRQPVLIEAKATPPEPVAAAPSTTPMVKGGFAPLPMASAPMKMAAAIIDAPPERVMAKVYEPAQPPSLVMLKPAAAAPAKPAAAPQAKPAAPPPAARSASAKPAAKSTPAKPAPSRTAAPARTVVAMAPARSAVAAAAPARPAFAAASPRSLAAAAPARTKKTAPATASVRAEPAAVDSDVALLSAIIMHASRHAAERAQLEAAQCGAGKKCPPHDAAPSLKATD